MYRLLSRLPLLLTLLAIAGALWYGPIPQLPHYHEFADTRAWSGMPNAADVLSNAGFAVAGLWGLLMLWSRRRHRALAAGWPGYGLFLVALVLTAAGSGYYHLAPDNARLVWDRLPIALACAGLLAGVRSENGPPVHAMRWTVLLALAGILSVVWWVWTDGKGEGDLRFYILLQLAPLVLIPLWQAIYRAPRNARMAFGVAVVLYIAAKIAELNDHAVLAATGWISGHSIKHLLATLAAAVLVAHLVSRVRATNV